MSQLKQDTIDKIAATLASGELTASEISQRIGVNWMGVESCLRGMRNRGEVVRIGKDRGTPFRFRLVRRIAA